MATPRYQPIRVVNRWHRLADRIHDAGPAAGRRPLRIAGLVLLALLGFALATSVRSERASSQLATARPDDLVRILDDLDTRSARLRAQIADLQRTRDRLAGSGAAAAALAAVQKHAQDLGILAGTLAAQGPGITLTISDPQRAVAAEVLVDVVEELRDAGAETLEVAGVRMGATSWISDEAAGLSVDGHAVSPPYVIKAIGDASTMAKALQIPGGVVDTVDARSGASATIANLPQVQIRSLRPLASPGYAQPSHH